MDLFDALIDDARLLNADPAATEAAVRDHLQCRVGASGELVGRLQVPDFRLAAIARCVPAGSPLAVSVVNSSGAGGIVSLAARVAAVPDLDVVAVESDIRDRDDPRGNAARIIAAVTSLDLDDLELYVGIPHVPGWIRAVEVIEAGGHFGKIDGTRIDDDEQAPALAVQLSTLVEADLAFTITLPPEPVGSAYALVRVLNTTAALIDGADISDATALLRRDLSAPPPPLIKDSWDPAARQRIRRRLRRVSGPVLEPATGY